MPKRRLTQEMRAHLSSLARRLIKCPEAEKAVAAAYKVAEPLVRMAVEKKYPLKDMRVLKKYEKAYTDDCIKLTLSAGGVDQFNFATKKGPLVAEITRSGAIYAADDATTEAFAKWKAATDALRNARARKISDYDALISASRTLEDVEAIWPEAAQIRPAFQSTALVVLTPDVIDRLKADVATREGSQPAGRRHVLRGSVRSTRA